MGNSTTSIRSVADYAESIPELKPLLATGGMSQQPALQIANDTIVAMVSPKFNFRWNRFKLPLFYTNSFQQDYAMVGVSNLAWLEHGILLNINSTSTPKDIWVLEVVRDLEMTSVQYGRPGQVSWLPNDQMLYGTWAANQTFGPLLGVPGGSNNPLMQIQDAFGNLWVVTGLVSNGSFTAAGTTGNSNPFVSNLNPTFPTFTNPTATATVVTDNTVFWTAVDPKGQGVRVNPIPPQTGVIFQFNLIGQKRPPIYTALSQNIEPVPDDYAPYFRRGFVAMAYMHSKDPAIRGKSEMQQAAWFRAMDESVRKSDRERDNTGLVPSEGVMPSPYSPYLGPASPFWPGAF
jgi:hypothetical protein